MPEQNKVLTNIPQSLTDVQKKTARMNMGVDHNVVFISNTSSPSPTLSQVQAMLDAGDYVILMYDDGNSNTADIPMLMLSDYRGSTPYILFTCVNTSGTIDVKLTGSGFDAPQPHLFDTGKIEIINIEHDDTFLLGGLTTINNLLSVGKIPVIRYEESTSPVNYGYYWPMIINGLGASFIRADGAGVTIISVWTTGSLYFSTYPCFDITNLAPQWMAAAYTRDSIVTDSGHVYRADGDVGSANTPSSPNSNWKIVNIARLLGRVRNAASEAALDPYNSTKWEVPNNALCEISTTATGPVAIEIDIAVEDAEVTNAAINIISQEGGTVTVKKNRYSSQDHALLGSETCFYSKSAGNEIPANKVVQITCVGNRWTWEEYVDPDAQNNAKGSNGGDEKEEPLVPLEEPAEAKT